MPDETLSDSQPTVGIGLQPAASPTTPAIRAAGERPGDWIGPYKLLQQIGEGGFGVVWLAERREPMVQRVALKVIKPGMDSSAVIARFEQERQALAVMDHPCVARVLDGGVTPAGRPYFVMEHVKGEPITGFADRNRLTIRQRLELFIPVCDAVQHAHMKGIIHRDIKPSNILVAPGDQGRAPVVKVIDFGVAKAVMHPLTDKTIFTEQGQIIGTPEYMSPEQAEMGAADIDTRADVYSLGVVLYELLSGTLPFDPRSLRAAGYAEIQRIIREVEPPRPSTRLSAADGRTGTAIAAARRADLARIAGELRRELEWIPLKALRKDRARRYASAESLAADLRRYLDGRPLEAAPESRRYLIGKFVRRNRAQVTAAGAVILALIAGVAATGLALRRALRAESAVRAQLAETEKAQQAERARADELQRVADFQSQILSQIDATQAGADLMADVCERFAAALEKAGVPDVERAARTAAFRAELARVNATDAAAAMIDRAILDPAAKAIDAQFRDQPLVDAQLRAALAKFYRGIGRIDAALQMQTGALEIYRRELGEDHPDTLESTAYVGVLLRWKGRLTEAEPLYRKAMEGFRRVLGEDHPNTLGSIDNYGYLLRYQGRFAEAELLLREALDTRRRALREDHPATINAVANMGLLLLDQGKLVEAESYLREALDKRRRALGAEHPSTLTSLQDLGVVLRQQGKLAEAEPYYREALEKRRRLAGEDHPGTLGSIHDMGVLLAEQGRPADAEPYVREALEKRRRVIGDDHPDTLSTIANMGTLLFDQGKLAEAEPYYREALESFRRTLGAEHPRTFGAINNLGSLLREQGRLVEAEPYCREALGLSRRVLGPQHTTTLHLTANLGRLLQQLGKHQEAVELLVSVEPGARMAFSGGNATRLAGLLAGQGCARVGLGWGSDAEHFMAAEANLLEAHTIFAEARGEAHKDTLGCVRCLVDLYAAWDNSEPDRGYKLKSAEWKAKLAKTVSAPDSITGRPAQPAAAP